MEARTGRHALTEKVMSKLLALATTALIFAASSFASTAQAGMRVGVGIGVGGLALGALGAMSNGGGRSEAREYSSRKRERAARREREEKSPSRSAKKSKSESTQQAEKEPAEKAPAFTATNEHSGIAGDGALATSPVTSGSTDTASSQMENSSISLADADGAAPKKIDTASQETTAKSLDCKKFFPSVGMTLSVPCE
jgi:hypothetical protein